MKQNHANPTSLRLAVAAGLGVLPNLAGAAGFALLEQNASGLANAYAGTAAVAEDASTIFFNPAGMTLLPGMQVVVAGDAIYVDSSFSGTGSETIPSPAVVLGSGEGGNAGGWAVVPSLYFAMPIGDRFAAGIGVGAPFGLKTEYDDDWLGRFQGIKSELVTINVNPSIAFKLTPTISLGAGINWQQADAELTNAVFLGAAGEGRTKLEADDDAWGWNVGALFQLGSDMRLGISYRSSMDYSLEGDVSTVTAAGAPVAAATFDAEADVEFPDSVVLSVAQMYGDKWQLLGDVQWTHWSTVDSIDVVNSSTGAVADTLVFDFDDTWRVALGLNYFHSEKWTFKGGIAWDQSPVDDDNRTVRLPDNDRIWLSLGAKYKFGKAGAIDVGYAHLFIDSPEIDRTRPLSANPPLSAFSTTVSGEYDASVDIVGVQLTWTF
jgi:long-chain fatty acid transport protein